MVSTGHNFWISINRLFGCLLLFYSGVICTFVLQPLRLLDQRKCVRDGLIVWIKTQILNWKFLSINTMHPFDHTFSVIIIMANYSVIIMNDLYFLTDWIVCFDMIVIVLYPIARKKGQHKIQYIFIELESYYVKFSLMFSFAVLLENHKTRRFVKIKMPLFPPFVSSTGSIRLIVTSPWAISRSLWMIVIINYFSVTK